MKKALIFLILVLVVAGIGWWYWQAAHPGSAVQAPALDAVVYPLYSGVTWGVPYAHVSSQGSGFAVDAAPVTDTNNIAAISTPFTTYYHDKLTAAGWTQDMNEEAGGPGAEVSVYRKGDQFVVVSFNTTFKGTQPNQPVQCPCDVTLSLMSGVQEGPTRGEQQAAHTYTDPALGFTITLPTALATSTSETLWSVDPSYEYTEFGPGKSIAGVKFTIPGDMATGTNLAADTYLSVEHVPAGSSSTGGCDAASFIAVPNAHSVPIQDGVVQYTFASSTDAAVGNRYEEFVYARTGSSPCIAVRYFIHYGVIENYPPGVVKAFDQAALLSTFDQIRRTLQIPQY